MKIYEIEESLLIDFIKKAFQQGGTSNKYGGESADKYAGKEIDRIAYVIGNNAIKEIKE